MCLVCKLELLELRSEEHPNRPSPRRTKVRPLTETERQRIIIINDRLCVAAWHDTGENDDKIIAWIAQSEMLLVTGFTVDRDEDDPLYLWMDTVEQWLTQQEEVQSC